MKGIPTFVAGVPTVGLVFFNIVGLDFQIIIVHKHKYPTVQQRSKVITLIVLYYLIL